MAECRRLRIFDTGPTCGCPKEACALDIPERQIAQSRASAATERLIFLQGEIDRKDAALDVAIDALDKLSRSGSLRRHVRESAVAKCREARNERLF